MFDARSIGNEMQIWEPAGPSSVKFQLHVHSRDRFGCLHTRARGFSESALGVIPVLPAQPASRHQAMRPGFVERALLFPLRPNARTCHATLVRRCSAKDGGVSGALQASV